MNILSKKFALGAAVAAFAIGTVAVGNAAHHEMKEMSPAETIKERQATMKTIAKNLKPIFKAGDASTIQKHVNEIVPAVKKAGKLFPKGSGPEAGVETRAKANIWTDWDNFLSKYKALVAAAENLEKVAATGNVGASKGAAKKLGGACKDCHETFRAPKKDK